MGSRYSSPDLAASDSSHDGTAADGRAFERLLRSDPELLRSLVEQAADAVCLHEIDGRIRGLAHNWDFDRIAKIDLAILRLAIFEMVYRKDIPPVVSINEAIDLSKQFSNLDAKRFINGSLDRMKDQLGRDSRKVEKAE